MEEEEGRGLHIAVFPWLAFGHLLPFLELSRRMALYGHRVSFLSTPLNIRRLTPRLPPTPLLSFVPFPLPSVEHLPPAAEASLDLPSDHLRPYLRRAYDSLLPDLSLFLSAARPDWLLCDYSAHWAPRAASDAGVPCAYVSLFSAATLVFFGPPSALKGGAGARTSPEEYTAVPDWVPFPSVVAYRPHEAAGLFAIPDHSGESEAFRFGAVMDGCHFLAVRTCTEFEPEWLQLLREIHRKPVVPVGFFPPFPHDDGGEEEEHEWASAFEWLETQAPGTVVYAAFGSEAKLTRAQVEGIALGLELSGVPFVWAARTPESWLPDGFQQRTAGRGTVRGGWAPQVRLLGHRAVGGFLTHGGWNSVIEGLSAGRALAVLPLMFDQGLNARSLVEKGLAFEVPRGEEGLFTGEGIAKSVRLVMLDEQGESVRAKAREWRGLFGDENTQDRYMEEFLEYLKEHKV